jgi:hypothetical protein
VDDNMSKLWKSDKRPSNNTVMLELQRLERITVALSIAIAEKRQKHIMNDLIELNNSITELRRLLIELEYQCGE